MQPIDDEYAPIADLYDWVTLYRERPDIGFYVEAARQAGGPVLEVGCGSGRVLLPTARAGIDITGVDPSPSMLAICQRRVDEDPALRQRVALHQGDLRSLDLGRRFALVTIPFRAFQHLLTVADQIAALQSVHRHLTDDGRVVVDLFNPMLEAVANPQEGIERDAAEPDSSTPDGRRITRKFKIVAHDRVNQVNQIELIYDVTHPGGREERLVHRFGMRYTFRYEAEHLLARCGFVVEHLYGGFDKSPFGTTYPGELIFVARRRP